MRHEARGKGVEGGLQARADSGSRSTRSSGTTRACKTGVQLDAQHAARRTARRTARSTTHSTTDSMTDSTTTRGGLRKAYGYRWGSNILASLALSAHTHST